MGFGTGIGSEAVVLVSPIPLPVSSAVVGLIPLDPDGPLEIVADVAVGVEEDVDAAVRVLRQSGRSIQLVSRPRRKVLLRSSDVVAVNRDDDGWMDAC